jgi:hypothetical protein
MADAHNVAKQDIGRSFLYTQAGPRKSRAEGEAHQQGRSGIPSTSYKAVQPTRVSQPLYQGPSLPSLTNEAPTGHHLQSDAAHFQVHSS